MSSNANYASIPKIGHTQISTANTNRDGTGAVSQVGGAGPNGSRAQNVSITATGNTSAGMVRLYECEGAPGAPIASITFVGTTATLNTTYAHGRTTGDKATVQNAFPFDFNVKDASITVLSPTSFSYPMATTPTVAASTVGFYFTTPAAPVMRYLGEVPVTAINPSSTTQAFSAYLTQGNTPWLPLGLPPGYSLRASTNNAETFNVVAQMGDF